MHALGGALLLSVMIAQQHVQTSTHRQTKTCTQTIRRTQKRKQFQQVSNRLTWPETTIWLERYKFLAFTVNAQIYVALFCRFRLMKMWSTVLVPDFSFVVVTFLSSPHNRSYKKVDCQDRQIQKTKDRLNIRWSTKERMVCNGISNFVILALNHIILNAVITSPYLPPNFSIR